MGKWLVTFCKSIDVFFTDVAYDLIYAVKRHYFRR